MINLVFNIRFSFVLYTLCLFTRQSIILSRIIFLRSSNEFFFKQSACPRSSDVDPVLAEFQIQGSVPRTIEDI